VRWRPPALRQPTFFFFGTRQNIRIQARHVRGYLCVFITGLVVSTHNRLERRHRTGSFGGVGKKVKKTDDGNTQILTGENLLLCCCGLVVPGRKGC
jgi:hypothetical protein